MPRDAAHEAEVPTFFSSPAGSAFRTLFSSVVGKAATQIVGAVRLRLFDDRNGINREIEAAAASVK